MRARVWEDLHRSQRFLRELIAERTGRDPDDFELRVVVDAGWTREAQRQD